MPPLRRINVCRPCSSAAQTTAHSLNANRLAINMRSDFRNGLGLYPATLFRTRWLQSSRSGKERPMSYFRIRPEQIDQYEEDGFFIVPHLLDAEEVTLLSQIARADHDLTQKKSTRADGQGGALDLAVNND